MSTSSRSKVSLRIGRGRTAAIVAVVALLVGAGVACAPGTPQAVLNVPGNYVANLWNPPPGYQQGAVASVIMCLDSTSAVRLETGDGGQGSVGFIRLEWAGSTYAPVGTGSAITLTTPVLSPGCGTLTFGPDCCHVDNYLAIKATKV